jgi:hypothetical protein
MFELEDSYPNALDQFPFKSLAYSLYLPIPAEKKGNKKVIEKYLPGAPTVAFDLSGGISLVVIMLCETGDRLQGIGSEEGPDQFTDHFYDTTWHILNRLLLKIFIIVVKILLFNINN